MFQYFLKVVSTQFGLLDGRQVKTHQYSVTQYERDLSTGAKAKDDLGHQTSHGYAGVPGVFFNCAPVSLSRPRAIDLMDTAQTRYPQCRSCTASTGNRSLTLRPRHVPSSAASSPSPR